VRAPEFNDYRDDYPHWHMERSDDGILLLRFHKDGGEADWSYDIHHETALLWGTIGADPETKVIIVTGTGEAFLRREATYAGVVDRAEMDDPQVRAVEWIDAHSYGKRIEMDLLEIEQPMIAAINGPCTIHAEQLLLCDIVLAAEHTLIADHTHMAFGLLPGDGVQVIYPLLMGLNRARYFMLTGQVLDAQRCLALGLFNEVLPADDVVPRAYEHARRLLEHKPMVLRLFRPTVLQQVKRMFSDNLSHGLMMEAIAAVAEFPDAPMPEVKTPSEIKAAALTGPTTDDR
jgi:enoyl-CoA hydratase/carnithine racemase